MSFPHAIEILKTENHIDASRLSNFLAFIINLVKGIKLSDLPSQSIATSVVRALIDGKKGFVNLHSSHMEISIYGETRTMEHCWLPNHLLFFITVNFKPSEKAEVYETLKEKGLVQSNVDVHGFVVSGFLTTKDDLEKVKQSGITVVNCFPIKLPGIPLEGSRSTAVQPRSFAANSTSGQGRICKGASPATKAREYNPRDFSHSLPPKEKQPDVSGGPSKDAPETSSGENAVGATAVLLEPSNVTAVPWVGPPATFLNVDESDPGDLIQEKAENRQLREKNRQLQEKNRQLEEKNSRLQAEVERLKPSQFSLC
jgi:hypothetical protein